MKIKITSKTRKKFQKNQLIVQKLLKQFQINTLNELKYIQNILYTQTDNRLNKIYKKLKKSKITYSELQKYKRFDSLTKDIRKIVKDNIKNTVSSLNSRLYTNIKLTFESYAWSIQNSINLSLAFNLPPKKAIEIAKSPFLNLAKAKLFPEYNSFINSTLIEGFKQGKSYYAISKNLNKIMRKKYYQIERIVRTEMKRTTHEAQNQEWLQSKKMGINTELKLLAVIDNRTREQSLLVDGKTANKEGKFQYPDGNYYTPGNTGIARWDINDREFVIEILKDEDMNINGRYIRDVGPEINEDYILNLKNKYLKDIKEGKSRYGYKREYPKTKIKKVFYT